MFHQAIHQAIGQALGRAGQASPAAFAAALALALAGCTETTLIDDVRVLDRPSAMSFSCYGSMVANDTGEIVQSAQPMSSCVSWRQGDIPPGQDALDATEAPLLIQFVLQSTRGSIAVAYYGASTELTPRFHDPDWATPGLNSIPVGSLPVDIATDPTGCHVMTANAGSCDLSILDVGLAMDPFSRPTVARLAVTSASGEPIGARPRAMAAAPGPAEVGVACADTPEGLVYIAYPDCNMVAAVNTATGEAVAGVVFHDDGTVELTDGNVGCAGTCGSQVTSPGGPLAARPSVLHLQGADESNPARLYIGAENMAALVMIDLGEDQLPAAVSSVPVEGQVGLLSLEVSEQVEFELAGAPYRFVYAVATDGTIRVIEVQRFITECDTQADTRYLHDVVDPTFVPCMPVGDPRTPPRRAGARSPGIHMPSGARALDAAFVALDNTAGDPDPPEDPQPLALTGIFAYATTSTGSVALINIDDQRYGDLEPQADDIALGLPHQVRDFGSSRDIEWNVCESPLADQSLVRTYTPRIEADPMYTGIPANKTHLVPTLRRLMCEDDSGQASVPELSIAAPQDVRRQTFPDFLAVPSQEAWALAWEGAVSRDSASTAVDGPPVRTGFFEVGGGQVAFGDGGGPFCRLGAEPYDILSLVGCDPARGNADCGFGEECYAHPDAPATVATGVCLPDDRAEPLSGLCRDFLVTRRRYTIREVRKDRLVLGERRRVLRTTPLTGCVSVPQCNDLYDLERALATSEHPRDLTLEPSPYTWACEPDPTRDDPADPDAVPARCVMTCEASDDCEAGHACSGGRCVEGVLPPAECVQSSQRYQVRVGDAFALIGSQTGFLHDRIVDPADPVSGQCIADPAANPLLVGRVPLDAPACESDLITEITPNPCWTTVEQAESEPIYTSLDTCSRPAAGQPQDRLVTRDAPAIRLRNPVFTFHMVDPVTTGDAQCTGDRMGTHDPHPTASPGYQMSFRVVGGHAPLLLPMLPTNGTRRLSYPVAIERGPYGNMWILDEGDRSSFIRGQILWFQPGQPTNLSTANYLQ